MTQIDTAALAAADRELRAAFEKRLALVGRAAPGGERFSLTAQEAPEDEALQPVLSRFYRAAEALSRDARRETAIEGPMEAALRLSGAENAQPQIGPETFQQALRLALTGAGIAPQGRKALVLGSGDEAETLAEMLLSLGALRADTALPENAAAFADAELLLNATAVGAYPDNGVSPVKLEAFPACRGVLDFISDPLRTALVLDAQTRGIPAAGGLAVPVSLAALGTGRFTGPAPEAEIGRLVRQVEAARGNFILIGVDGCRAEAKILAALTGREAVFLDDEIARAAEKPVSELFRDDGEAVYRFFERRAAAKLGACKGLVLAASSGIAADARNRGALRQNGRVYYLRGQSQSETMRRLEAERDETCRAFADLSVDCGETPEASARAVLQDYKSCFEL